MLAPNVDSPCSAINSTLYAAHGHQGRCRSTARTRLPTVALEEEPPSIAPRGRSLFLGLFLALFTFFPATGRKRRSYERKRCLFGVDGKVRADRCGPLSNL